MTVITDIDALAGYVPKPIIFRLAIRPRLGQPLVLELTEPEALWLWQQLDAVLPEIARPSAVCPSWGEMTGNGWSSPEFSKDICDEFDRRWAR
jgi:hypothetical protein